MYSKIFSDLSMTTTDTRICAGHYEGQVIYLPFGFGTVTADSFPLIHNIVVVVTINLPASVLVMTTKLVAGVSQRIREDTRKRDSLVADAPISY
jgi:hypothetical protein